MSRASFFLCILIGLTGTLLRAGEQEHFQPEAAKQLLERGIEELVFIKRDTLTADHVYTEYVNSRWLPGAQLCILDLKTGKTRDLVPELDQGVFNRFDVSHDAQKVIFDYKAGPMEGYRIYEVNIDGSNLRQLTFPLENEADLVKKLGNRRYHHGTDDMHPCYLPDGGIAFTSTRCQYGILCNWQDELTTKILHRMNADGKNIRQLSNSALSEACPVMLPDGRILYHRWEYNDKAAGNAKCLWSMRTDGSGSAEVYGNTLTHPETLIHARPIPGAPDKIVTTGATHCCPNNAVGTILVIDTTKNIRTREPMTYITKDVDARTHCGFHFLVDGKWVYSKTGTEGRLLRDPYPLSENLFLVTQKLKGSTWDDPDAYDLYLLKADGSSSLLFGDDSTSCWHPFPLKKRKKEPVATTAVDQTLARQQKARCVVTDVYVGMDGVERGSIKFLRILEQVSRPWASRHNWKGDADGMAHSALGTGRLGLKVQYGIVPVEADGSAYFEVPADRNIYFQALDEHYMAVQTERTYINYIPGETRGCIGCHEMPKTAPTQIPTKLIALQRPPSQPQAQPGESKPEKTFNFLTQIQPIFDRHCNDCHSGEAPKGGLNLSGEPTKLYTKSYEALMRNSKSMKMAYVGEWRSANENVGSADISYRQPFTSGSHTSPLITVVSNGKIPLKHRDAEAITKRLTAAHKNIQISQAEFVQLANWLDAFSQFYPSYWGRKNLQYKDQPHFRPEVTHAEAISRSCPPRFFEAYQ